MDAYTFEKLAEKIIDIKLSSQLNDSQKKNQYITKSDLISISEILKKVPKNNGSINVQIPS